MYKKLLFLLIATVLTRGTNCSENSFLPKNVAWTAISKGIKCGGISALVFALPSILMLNNSSTTEKLALPFLSGITGATIGLIGGAFACIPLVKRASISNVEKAAIVNGSKGMSIGFGTSIGLLFCLANKLTHNFSVFNP